MIIFGTHQPNTLDQFYTVADSCVKAALMADGHLGYDMPIGGVAAYRNQVSVTGVGFDIACGNAAIQTDLEFGDIVGHRRELADEIASTIAFGTGKPNQDPEAPCDHPLFNDPAWDALPESINKHNLKGKARAQLGSVGSGNHYVDIFMDEEMRIWVGVHFGSRGFGYTVAKTFLRTHKTQQPNVGRQAAALLDLDTPLGDAYWSLMKLAGQYAYAGREWVARRVTALLGGKERDLVHNHHNFAWKEAHGGEPLVVVRKGATPAWPGQRGFVGGSMGDISVILRGAVPQTQEENNLAQQAMRSTVHGAGRVMSRTKARGKKNWKTGEIISPGEVTQDMMDEWLERKGVIRRGGGLDESPHAYRRLPEVLEAQGPTIEILHTLEPLIVVMAP